VSSVRRVYFYLVTLITLGIFAGGVGTLLSLLFDITISAPSAIGQPRFNQQQLSLGLAMLVIGGPLWFIFWRIVQRHVNGNAAETGATLRKFFLNFVLVVTSLTAVFAAQTFLLSEFIRQPGDTNCGLNRLVLSLARLRK
jgi:H+/Cl- antiporter ClcA